MLLELIVENYAVVEQARIRFQPGLNILTGETGSGKSIVVDSLSLLLGARASPEMIRSGESKARVSGIFSLDPTPELTELLESAGIERNDDDELIVEREISSNSKSRAFVSNRPVTTAFLRQLASALGDIHGQSEQQQLFSPQVQRGMLDEFAHCGDLLSQIARLYAQWRETGEKLRELTENEQERLRLLDLWSFQRKEIESVAPRPGEDYELESDRKILQNVTKLQEHAAAAFSLVYESSGSATSQLRQASKRLDELLRIDPSLQEAAASLKQSSVLIDEVAYTLRDYLAKLEGDPKRLEDVESRLDALDRLKRKYGRTLEDVLAFERDVSRRADEVENAGEHKAQLEKQQNELAREYEKAAAELTKLRSGAAWRLSRQVENELKSLAMSGTQFEISMHPAAWSATGADDIAFLVSPNKGEELKLMDKIASGGELSRIALALKTAIGDAAHHGGIQTLVFDEVDAGVGGAAAAAVGKRLKKLSRGNQVICVTHLAQIAGFADHHYAVSKRERKGRVTTAIDELAPAARAHEIGRMLSGERVTPEALKHAEQLIAAGAKE